MQLAQIKYCLLLAMSICISGCFESTPPDGFDAVVPAQDNVMRRGCPNLVDTYVVTSAQEYNKLLQEPVDGKDFSYFSIDSLVADQAYNYALRVDRNYFIRYAENLKNSALEKFSPWRENTLLLKKNYSNENLANILKYGAAFERRGQFHVYECNAGWVKVQQVEKSVWDVKKQENYIKQDDVWLARDKYGDLLIHIIGYRETPGWTFWAAGGAGTRLTRESDDWSRLRKASDNNLTGTWSEADLPAVKSSVQDTGRCHVSSYEIIDFNQRLIQSDVIIEKFSHQSTAANDGTCIQSLVRLGFASNSRAQGAEVIKLIEKDPLVDHTELLETSLDPQGRSHYLLQVSLRGMKH